MTDNRTDFPLEVIPQEVADIATTLINAGFEAWYVGGAVRDTLLSLPRTTHHAPRTVGSAARDFDIATSATPPDVLHLFRRTVPIGIDHGTIAVLDNRNIGHEVTTFRRDVKTDGRHAVVEFGVSLDDDLARRDFTINAMAVHPVSGELRDPFGGRQDLELELVRAVGDPVQRFREDRLRVLRGLRFRAVLGFQVESATWEAIRGSAGELEHLSRERVRDEWLKTVGRAGRAGVRGWREAGVLGRVWPLLAQVGESHEIALEMMWPEDGVLATAFILFLAGVLPETAESAVLRLRFSNQDASRIRAVIAGLRDELPAEGDARALRHWLSRHRPVWRDVVRDGERRAEVETLLAAQPPLSLGELAISGNDLKQAGIDAGPRMGEVLRRLLKAVLDDPSLNERDKLLALARSL